MSKEESGKGKRSTEEPGNALAARRARLRSSLTTQAISAPPSIATSSTGSTEPSTVDSAGHTSGSTSGLPITEQSDSQALELLGNIDQALSSCATHLASLQKVAAKQIDELKIIADTLQHQSIPEVGLNINTLMESLTAAIEPMKAIGELVPALDRLVSVSTLKTEPATRNHLTEKQLVLSLAEQLAAGAIDANTFKSAYQAIFPDYDLNGLLHQLSELLGEHQLSGDIFQTAFSALQSGPMVIKSAATQPMPASTISWADEISDSALTMQPTPVTTESLISERETELEKQLADKEREIAEYKEHLDQRWQELNDAYEELRATLLSRDNILQEKENELGEKITELSAKNSENKQLRAQMEELRDQTKEMVTDLQEQLAQKHAEEKAMRTAKTKAAAPQPGFFELFTANQMPLENEQDASSYTGTVPAAPNQPVQASTHSRPVANPQPVANTASNNQDNSLPNLPGSQAAAPQSGFASPAASFVSAAGSYGSGVRAQVFEVIVRQALAGAHWREICAVPMQINNISPEEVESEVKRRQALLKK